MTSTWAYLGESICICLSKCKDSIMTLKDNYQKNYEDIGEEAVILL